MEYADTNVMCVKNCEEELESYYLDTNLLKCERNVLHRVPNSVQNMQKQFDSELHRMQQRLLPIRVYVCGQLLIGI